MQTRKVIKTIVIKTINRGFKTYVISQDEKGFFAHELGEPTDWAIVFGSGERKAHIVNQTRKVGNQFGRYFKPIPFASIEHAEESIKKHSVTKILYF